MQILILNSEYPPLGGGAGHACENMARVFVRLGHQVKVITARYPGLLRDEVRQGVQILRVPSGRRRLDRSNALEQVWYILSGCLAALRETRSSRPDAVLAFFGVPSGAIALVLKGARGSPYVVSLRGGDVPGFRPYDFALYHRLAAPLIRRVWHNARHVVANSPGLRELALRFDPLQSIAVIPNGVDPDAYPLGSPVPGAFRLLFVGRLVYQKGADLLLEALAACKPLSWTLSLVGEGPRRHDLETQAGSLGISDRIRFLGWLQGRELAEQYRTASCLVLPSRHEGMPNVVLEAMASGLPVVASRIAGSIDLVQDNRTGRLVPPEDPAALADALASLIRDPDLARRLGAVGRERAVAEFSWESVVERYLALLAPEGGS